MYEVNKYNDSIVFNPEDFITVTGCISPDVKKSLLKVLSNLEHYVLRNSNHAQYDSEILRQFVNELIEIVCIKERNNESI